MDYSTKLPKRTWKDGVKDKAMCINLICTSDSTIGYYITWWLWAADIWFGRVPMIKLILALNVVVWVSMRSFN